MQRKDKSTYYLNKRQIDEIMVEITVRIKQITQMALNNLLLSKIQDKPGYTIDDLMEDMIACYEQNRDKKENFFKLTRQEKQFLKRCIKSRSKTVSKLVERLDGDRRLRYIQEKNRDQLFQEYSREFGILRAIWEKLDL